MNEWYAKRCEEQNEDAKTFHERDMKVRLTNKQMNKLEMMALKAGLKNAEGLIASFVGDLTEWQSNGSDERHMANGWYERAFGTSLEDYAFFRYHCYNYDYHIDDLIDALEDEDTFEDMYKDYVSEYEWNKSVTLESKEACRKVIEELTASERHQRSLDNKAMLDKLKGYKLKDTIIARFKDKEIKAKYTLGDDMIEIDHESYESDIPLVEGIPYLSIKSVDDIEENDNSIYFSYLCIKWEIEKSK